MLLESHHRIVDVCPNVRELGSKIAHFKQLHKKTGIPYSEMVS